MLRAGVRSHYQRLGNPPHQQNTDRGLDLLPPGPRPLRASPAWRPLEALRNPGTSRAVRGSACGPDLSTSVIVTNVSNSEFRFSVRGLVIEDEGQILLCRHALPGTERISVWAAPGGGVESDESPIDALRRELREEIGLTLYADPPHVWHQVIAPSDTAGSGGHTGVVNDYFLIRVATFAPRPRMSKAELLAENINDLRWWPLVDIASYGGTDLFSPRNLATPLSELLEAGAPNEPVQLGL